MSAWNIAVIGATGAVGSAIIDLLEERQFPVAELTVFASDNNLGETVRFQGKTAIVKSLDESDFDWSAVNIAFFAASAAVTKQYAVTIADMGCVVIDLSGFFANRPEVPVIVPGINNHELADYRNSNIITVANGVTCQLLKSVLAITAIDNITQLHVSTYLPASFYGKSALDGLAGQSVRLLNGLSIDETQLAFNLQPVIRATNALLPEAELALQCRRVLGCEQLPISFDFIDVPVFYGLSQAVNLSMQYPVELEQLSDKINQSADIELLPNQQLPTPVSQQEANNCLRMGHLRYAYTVPELLQFWSVSDNVRYLGAYMAVNIAESLIEEFIGY
ncbi:aspartate-semialdehyde dehydrogenase [Utexia brackfieldae]|uniref:aspartate-semialdehyde dehydrogenase n=1 Tax=Utexia brackfieldae TaxID=3074108 RepID=UPI00370D4202